MVTSTALLTDHYELTMLQAALAGGTAHRRSVFELFPRRLPEGRRYGVVAGVGLLWMVLVVVLLLAARREPDRASLRDVVRLVPDLLRLLRRLAADPTLPRGVRWRLER